MFVLVNRTLECIEWEQRRSFGNVFSWTPFRFSKFPKILDNRSKLARPYQVIFTWLRIETSLSYDRWIRPVSGKMFNNVVTSITDSSKPENIITNFTPRYSPKIFLLDFRCNLNYSKGWGQVFQWLKIISIMKTWDNSPFSNFIWLIDSNDRFLVTHLSVWRNIIEQIKSKTIKSVTINILQKICLALFYLLHDKEC